ncbi:peptidyl-prolyl cis-trans isomerase D [Dysgonomonadaceae bacterium PH5-43]|nr:peptidyl-prolyl cis-trans isomerase D [Dysgonomonadaceae bacterium PH5-43]
MAMLEKIRSKAVLLVVVVGVALLAFIIGDFLNSGSTFFHQKKENVVVVNGEGIHFQDFQAKVDARVNGQKMNTGKNLSDDEMQRVRLDVYNSLIDNMLYKEEADKLGIVVSKEEYFDMTMGDNVSPMIQQMPAFQNPETGRFDKDILIEFLQLTEAEDYDMYPAEYQAQLKAQKQQWLIVEDLILEEQLKSKFSTLVASAVLTNSIEAKESFENNKISVDFDYVAQPYSSIPDSEVSVSDAEIQKRYNETKESYSQEEAKLLNYIAINIKPSKADFENVETKLSGIKADFQSKENVAEIVQINSDFPYVNAYRSFNSLDRNLQNFVGNNTIGSVEGPLLIGNEYHLYKLEGEKVASDSVKFNMLPLPMFNDEATFKTVTDSLMQVVKTTSFSEMALSATGGQSNGEFGWATEMELASQANVSFKDQVFNAKVNDLFIAEIPNGGKFMIQILEKTAPVKKYKIADIQVVVNPSQETKRAEYNALSQYVSNNHSVAAMKDNASEAGYNLRADVEIVKDQINLGGIQNTRQIVQWAFNQKDGAISDIYECQNGEYLVVAAVASSLAEGYRPLASVTNLIERELINEKKGEKILADLKSKNLTTMEQYAEALGTTPQSVKFVTFATSNISGIGNEPVLNAEAPLAQVGEVAGPFLGKSKAYIIYVTDKKVGEEEYNEDMQKQQLQMQNSFLRYSIMQSADLLRENATIDSNFNNFY